MSAVISKKLWFGHLYLGIAIALPLLIIAASGIVLSFYDDLRYTAPPYRLASPVYRSLDADTLAESVRRHYPRHRLEALFLPTAPEHSARARLAGPEPLLVFIDPGTTAILETKDAADLDGLDWLRELHRGSVLGLPGKIAASMAGLGTLFLWLMGFWLWYRLSATAKRQRHRAKFFPGLVTIHRQTGLLLGGPIAVLALLGALLNFAGPLMQWLDPPPAIVTPTSTQQLTTLPLPRLVDAAVNGYRDSPLERIYFPATANQPWRFRFLDGSWGFVDGQNGTLLKLKTPSSHWTMLLYPLHSGKLPGIYGHWLLIFCGFVLLFLVSSGLRHGWRIIKPHRR
ncbi:MAG: PepSY domain-containing protein [Methylobacter sp.]|uniref:PepSY-associated TM helix domain-containing protein n=1 Tax=Methylobacter sp. TaxID=2051955 RepID=UPI0025CB89B9|nr:PepSY-associated TM helix domain-containing protein [Methylobacter sp.]MCK9622999.1 PepSY domain-containing protein [Methylobacter sp.]